MILNVVNTVGTMASALTTPASAHPQACHFRLLPASAKTAYGIAKRTPYTINPISRVWPMPANVMAIAASAANRAMRWSNAPTSAERQFGKGSVTLLLHSMQDKSSR
jgi:hypothetical protein